MKALRQGKVSEARALVRLGANLKEADGEGISPIDFIISNKIKCLLDEIGVMTGDRAGDLPAPKVRHSPAIKKREDKRRPVNKIGSAVELDACENNTTLSEDSARRSANKRTSAEEQVCERIRELASKTEQICAQIEKLKNKNLALKRKLKTKRKNELHCLISQPAPADPMQAMVEELDREIRSYIAWIEAYRRASRPFFANIHDMVKGLVQSHFNDNVRVCTTGSFQNGLIMPWSDLNLTVTFPVDQRSDSKRRGCIIDSARRFSKVLQADRETVRTVDIEERSSLLILKLELTKKFRYQSVEIIFKYYVNPAYPSNEEIMDEYLARYPLSKPLYVLFRSLLHKSALDDPSQNGLKSVAIFLMVVAYLQHAQEQNMTLGQLFINFLFFYSYGFDLYKDSIHPYPASASQPHLPFVAKDARRKIHSLMVVNPYNDEIILTKSFKRSTELKQLIRLAYISLFTRCGCTTDRDPTASPVRQPKAAAKRPSSDNFADKRGDPLDRFKSISVRCLQKVAKKPPKLSLCLDTSEPKLASRASFSINRPVATDQLEEQLLAPSRERPARPSRFLLHTLISYNYEPTPNI